MTQRSEITIGTALWHHHPHTIHRINSRHEEFRRVYVVGETIRSWVCASNPNTDLSSPLAFTFKAPKTARDWRMLRVYTDEERADIEWADRARHRISSSINTISPDMLRRVARVIDFKES